MRKKMMVQGILVVLLIGIVSSSLVGFLSNKVIAQVRVSGPFFSLDGEDLLDGKTLILNGEPQNIGEVIIDGPTTALFYSDLWKEKINFYPHDFVVYLDADIISNTSNENLTSAIKVDISVTNSNGLVKRQLCSNLLLGVAPGEDIIEIPCQSLNGGLSNLNKGDRLRLRVIDEGGEEFYGKIYLNENSKIVVVKK